MVAHIEGEN